MPIPDGWIYTPMVRSHRDGRPYQRNAEVERQISFLHSLPDSRRRAELLGDARSARERQFKEETIVYAIRQYHRLCDTDAVDALAHILVHRIAGSVQRLARSKRVDPENIFDLHQDMAVWLWEAVRSDADADTYGEVCFWPWMLRRANTLLKALRSTRIMERHESDFDIGNDSSSSPIDLAPSPGLDPAALAELRHLLDRLDPDDRELFELKYFYEVPETSQDSEATTLANIYGVSDRTIRNRLKRILRILNEED
jgi:RNA polymerase sigma factor (sigma-70 family)